MILSNDYFITETEDGKPIEYEVIFVAKEGPYYYGILLEWDPFKKDDALSSMVARLIIKNGEIESILGIEESMAETVFREYERYIAEEGQYADT